MSDDYPTNLVEWMRKNGVSGATLSPDGKLTSLTLGAPPVAEDQTTQPSTSPADAAPQDPGLRRPLHERSSGGPVRRLSVDGS